MKTDSSALRSAIADVVQSLGAFAADALFTEKFKLVFGTEMTPRRFRALTSASARPPIEVVEDGVLGMAIGAFSAQTGKIYLSQSLVDGDGALLRAVLLEEVGHYLDSVVNAKDTPGDEGELFSALVRGVSLSTTELSRIKTEDDQAVLVIDGQETAIELSAPIVLMVNTTTDENDGSATIGEGLSLRDAISIANQNPNTPYIIKLKSGANYLLNNKTSLDIYGDYLTIEADDTNPANILGSSASKSTSFFITDSLLRIQSLTSQKVILNYISISNDWGNGVGRALVSFPDQSSELEVNNSIISGNFGYGIHGYNPFNPAFSINVNESQINNNYLDGIFTNGVSSVKNSIINGNGGKGIYNLGTIEIASTIVNNNINTGIDNSGKATLTDSFVTGNASGGISNFGEIDISNSVISNNTALQLTLQFGGGIRNSGKLNLSKSTVASNTAIIGGGIHNSGVVNSSNSVISNNKAADGSGGGIYNSVFINSGVVNLSNDTITGNYAGNFGGGIYNSGTLNSSANISGNTAGKVWYRSPEGIIRDSINPEYIIDPQYPNVYDKGKLVASPPTSPPTPEPSKPVVSVSAWVEIPAGDTEPKTLEFTVTLSSASDKPIILDYYLLDGSANSLEKKNEQDKNHKQDFVGLSIADPLSIDLKQIKQTLVFFPGEDIKKIKVPVLPKTPNTVIDKTFEIFARDTAYRPWTNADKGKEVDQVYNYDDLEDV